MSKTYRNVPLFLIYTHHAAFKRTLRKGDRAKERRQHKEITAEALRQYHEDPVSVTERDNNPCYDNDGDQEYQEYLESLRDPYDHHLNYWANYEDDFFDHEYYEDDYYCYEDNEYEGDEYPDNSAESNWERGYSYGYDDDDDTYMKSELFKIKTEQRHIPIDYDVLAADNFFELECYLENQPVNSTTEVRKQRDLVLKITFQTS